MYVNRDYKYVNCNAGYEEVRELLYQAIYEGRTVYVIDQKDAMKGVSGKQN